jgi:hypothetical protein
MNQCDGCRRGLPMEDGVHYNPDGSYDHIGCTARFYESTREQAEQFVASIVDDAEFGDLSELQHALENEYIRNWLTGEIAQQLDAAPSYTANHNLEYKNEVLQAALLSACKEIAQARSGVVSGKYLRDLSVRLLQEHLAAGSEMVKEAKENEKHGDGNSGSRLVQPA